MERTIETTGKTVEQAIQEALEELGVKEDLALIEVLDEGETGGLLGFGRRPARVRVSVDDSKVPVSEKASEPTRKTDAEEDESGWKVALDDRGFVPAENAAWITLKRSFPVSAFTEELNPTWEKMRVCTSTCSEVTAVWPSAATERHLTRFSI